MALGPRWLAWWWASNSEETLFFWLALILGGGGNNRGGIAGAVLLVVRMIKRPEGLLPEALGDGRATTGSTTSTP